MNKLYTLLIFFFLNACVSDNEKGGIYSYNIIENETDKELIIESYSNAIKLDSFFIEPYSFRTDTGYNGNGEQFSYSPIYLDGDSVAVIFNNSQYINYTVFYNQTPNYSTVNNKNILRLGWNLIESYTKKKYTYNTTVFEITEQDYLLADSL